MRRTSIARIATALLLVTLAAVPSFAAARGKADFTRYFALGTSYGAGVESNSLLMTHQQYSYPAIIAKQAGLRVTTDCIGSSDLTCFQIPWVGEPGLGPELALTSLSPLVLGPKSTVMASPFNLNLPRPYNNLSIPGSVVHDLTTLTGAQPATNTARSTAQFILRGLGTSVQQLLSQHPTFITIDTGGNDVLGAVLAGTPAALTPLDSFKTDFAALLDTLIAGAPDAGIVVMGVADVSALPFATTLPPVVLGPNSQPVIVNGAPIPLFADLGGGTLGVLPSGSLVTLGAASLLPSGYGIPPTLATMAPFNLLPNAGKPLPDAVVITPTELAAIQTRVTEVQAAIVSIAGPRNVPVVDLNNLLSVVKNGHVYGGVTITGKFLSGGMFSYDGFHPTDIGYTLIANEWIKTINANYGTHIPLAPISAFFQNNAPNQDFFSLTAVDPLSLRIDGRIEWLGTPEAATTPRRRAVRFGNN
jgi:lysophospholipase L1-like esterase